MGRVQAKARANITTTIGLKIRYADWFLALRRALFVLFLVDVVAAESQLSALVIKGDGADKVVASPSLVALLLFASLSAAALLRWHSISHGAQCGLAVTVIPPRHAPRDALQRARRPLTVVAPADCPPGAARPLARSSARRDLASLGGRRARVGSVALGDCGVRAGERRLWRRSPPSGSGSRVSFCW